MPALSPMKIYPFHAQALHSLPQTLLFSLYTPSIVNVYEWNESAPLRVKRFDGTSAEWLDMVVACRSRPNFRHDYDIVIGKIANDNVGETVSYVVQGIMRREDAIARLRFEKINNQIAFCTEAALQELKFIESYEAEEL